MTEAPPSVETVDFQPTPSQPEPIGQPQGTPAPATPPLVPLVLRVGVTGHRPDPAKRPDPDVAAVRAVLREVFRIISGAANGVADVSGHLFLRRAADDPGTGAARCLRVISALASGADQWAAAEALELGYELQSPLPFDRDEYRNDFTNTTEAAEFERLLSHATAVLELDGRVVRSSRGVREPDSRSYEAVGRAILNQSDLLVAVWDGEPAGGTGGTGHVVEEALRRGIAVVWIPWGAPGAWRLQLPAWRLIEDVDDAKDDCSRLTKLVRELLLPPDESECHDGRATMRATYFAEAQKGGDPLIGCWTSFRNLVCVDPLDLRSWKRVFSRKPFRAEDFEETTAQKAARGWTRQQCADRAMQHPVSQGLRAWVDAAFLKHYAWANGLSIYYGNLHRSAFLVNFLLAACAVFLALVCVAAGIAGRWQTGWILAELIVILVILGLTRLGRRRHWHQRWIDYRTLAERLRVARCASPFGGGGPQVVHAGHLAGYGNPLRTWMHWHFRAIERAAGLPNAKCDGAYLASCQEFWRESLLTDQILYHRLSADRFGMLDRRLHVAGDALFVLTLVACALHVAHLWAGGDPRFTWLPHWTPGWLTLGAAFFPALGAAFAAIRSQSEALRLAQRSRAMDDGLTRLRMDLASVSTEGAALNSLRLRECFDRVSDLMIREMLDWRVVFQDRPLVLPM
jgi:hypothetical protein